MLRNLFSTKKVVSNGIHPEDDPNSIGNLAVEKGYITLTELKEALMVQAERMKLGEILVESGKLTEEQRDELIMEQKIRKGEIRDPAVIHQFERTKKRRRLTALREGFKEAGESAQELTASITAQAKAFSK